MELKTTGERVIEESYRASPGRYLIYLFHLATYRFALQYVRGKNVLDYGCGSGYGSHFLADQCRLVKGVDISGEAIEYASSHYQADNLEFSVIAPSEQAPLPFSDSSFEVVVSFQVIEHISNIDSYLGEIFRVLTPGGVFICATPDRSTRLLRSQKPWNLWHIREYSSDALQHILSSRFMDVEVLKMGGRKDVLDIELRRTRRLMWSTLPFTLPFVPEFIRRSALRLLKMLAFREKSYGAGEAKVFDFDERDITIAPDVDPSTNLIAVARKR